MGDRIDLEGLLVARHQAPEWATFVELRNQAGYARQGRRFDVAAFNAWPSKREWRVVYEVKRSRSDFLRELAAPEKREDAERYFHETWIATTHGVCEVAEVPDGWGLIVATKDGQKLRTLRAARAREPEEVPYSMVLAMLRRVSADLLELRQRHSVRYAGREVSEEDFRALVEAEAVHVRELLANERKVVMRERDELVADRRRLVGPLRSLVRAAQKWHVSDAGLGELTEDDVDTLIARAAECRIGEAAEALRCAHAAIGSAVSRLGEHVRAEADRG